MDLIEEIRKLRRDIEDAIDDGKITFVEALRIARDIVQILQIVLPLIVGGIESAAKQTEAGNS